MTHLGPTASAAWEADDEGGDKGGAGRPASSSSSSSSSEEDPDARPTVLSKKMRMARRNPIRFGFTPRPLLPQPPSTSPARTSTSTAARPNSSASPPAAPARVSLPFENGSDGSGETEVERVTLRRQKRDRPVAASTTTVEKFLQSGKVAEATQQLAKGKGKVVKRLAGRPGNSRKAMNPKAHLQPLKPGHTRTRRVPRQPSGLDSPLRALQLASSPPSPAPVFDSSIRRRSTAASVRTPARSRPSAYRTPHRPDFSTFPRFPTTADAAGDLPTPLRWPQVTPPREAPVRALSDWMWGFDLDSVRGKGVRDVLGDVDMIDGRTPAARRRAGGGGGGGGGRRSSEKAKAQRSPGNAGAGGGNEVGRRNGLPALTLVQPESDNDADESAANSPYRLPAPPLRPAGRLPLASGVTPTKRPRAAQPVFRPRPFIFPSVPQRDTLSTAALSESVVDRETNRESYEHPSLSTTVNPTATNLKPAGRHTRTPPARSSPLLPPSTSNIAESSAAAAATDSAGPALQHSSQRQPSMPLSGLITSLLSEFLAQDSTTGLKGKGVPLRRTSVVGPTLRRDVFGGETIDSVDSPGSPAARQEPRIVGRSGSTVENGSPTAVGAPHPRPTPSADVSIQESTDGSVVGRALAAPAVAVAASASVESFSGGMSFPPDEEPVHDGAEPMDDVVEGNEDVRPLPLLTATAHRSQPLTTEEACEAALSKPLILALSSGDHHPPPAAARRSTPQLPPEELVPLTRDLSWRHLTLSQASSAAKRVNTVPQVELGHAPRGQFSAIRTDSLTPQRSSLPAPFAAEAEAPAAFGAKQSARAAAVDDWALEGMVNLTEILAYEQQNFFTSSRSTNDDMDVGPDSAEDAEAEAWRVMVEVMKEADAAHGPADQRSPSPTPVEQTPVLPPGYVLPSLHFPSSATPAPSTPPSTPPAAPPLAFATVRNVKGILRLSSPATEVDTEGKSATGRSRRSKTVTFAPSDDEGNLSDARHGRSASPAARSLSKSLGEPRPPAAGPSRTSSNPAPAHRIPRFNSLQRLPSVGPRPTSRRSSKAAGTAAATIPSYQPRPAAGPDASHVEPTFLSAATLIEAAPVLLSASSPLSSLPTSSFASAAGP